MATQIAEDFPVRMTMTRQLTEEALSDERERMARKLLQDLQSIYRSDIAVAKIVKVLDAAYKQNR